MKKVTYWREKNDPYYVYFLGKKGLAALKGLAGNALARYRAGVALGDGSDPIELSVNDGGIQAKIYNMFGVSFYRGGVEFASVLVAADDGQIFFSDGVIPAERVEAAIKIASVSKQRG